MSSLFDEGDFKWIQKGVGIAPKIFCKDAQTKEKATNWLSEQRFQFNTYADDTNRQKSLIVRGLCCGQDEENIALIKSTLTRHGLQGECKVERFLTGRLKQAGDNANLLYRITVPSSLDDQFFKSIRTIGVFGVRFEKMKNGSVIQCRNCQRFSHTARQCFFQYRCVKCCSSHNPGQCPRNQNPDLPVACVNCQEHELNHIGHSANQYSDCQYYQTRRIQKQPNNNAIVTHRTNNSKPTESNTAAAHQQRQNTNRTSVGANNLRPSWAQVAARSSNSNTKESRSDMGSILKELLPGLIKLVNSFNNGF